MVISVLNPGAGKGEMLTTNTDGETSSSEKPVPRKHKYRMSAVKCFGVDLSPDNVAVAMVYFVQGVLGLARLAVNFYLKDDLHLDPAEVCVLNWSVDCHGVFMLGIYLVPCFFLECCNSKRNWGLSPNCVKS